MLLFLQLSCIELRDKQWSNKFVMCCVIILFCLVNAPVVHKTKYYPSAEQKKIKEA
jgi:hypothetical protein